MTVISSRLHILCQTRAGDLETFFMHENQAAPPSLSLGGKLRLGTKADLLDCLGVEEIQSTGSPAVDAKLLDGASSSHAQSWHSKNFSRIFRPSVSSLCLKSANNSHESGYSVGCIYSRYRERHYQEKERKGHPKASGSKFSNPEKLERFSSRGRE